MDFLPKIIQGPGKYDWMGLRRPAALDDLLAVSMEDVQRLMDQRLRTGALEVTIVGDIIPGRSVEPSGSNLGSPPLPGHPS